MLVASSPGLLFLVWWNLEKLRVEKIYRVQNLADEIDRVA
jgi:hypothetical protein